MVASSDDLESLILVGTFLCLNNADFQYYVGSCFPIYERR